MNNSKEVNMKKNLVLFFTFFIFVFSCLILNAWASEYVVFLSTNNIRSGPSTNYSVLGLEAVGSSYYLKSSNLVKDEKQMALVMLGGIKLIIMAKLVMFVVNMFV